MIEEGISEPGETLAFQGISFVTYSRLEPGLVEVE